MHNGEPTWKFRIGPKFLNLHELKQISFPRDDKGIKSVEAITDDIRLNGLKDALEVEWLVNEIDELRIFKGNQRIQALRTLGYTQAPCYVTIEGYQETEKIGKLLKILTRI